MNLYKIVRVGGQYELSNRSQVGKFSIHLSIMKNAQNNQEY